MAAASDVASAGDGGSQGYIIVNLNAFLIAISTALVFSRVYVRFCMIKAHGWDDIIVLITFVRVGYPMLCKAVSHEFSSRSSSPCLPWKLFWSGTGADLISGRYHRSN
ncbi:hypothetical protein AUP68_00486 [Ilyonectria robusta]